MENYKCAECERLNNFSEEMRCDSCGFLHNKQGTEQLFSMGFIYNGQKISDLDEVNENQLRMILGLSTVSDEIWRSTLKKGTYVNSAVEYFWETVDDNNL